MFARAICALGLLVLVVGCVPPQQGSGQRQAPQAFVYVDGANVWLGNRKARNGERVRPGQTVRTGPSASALIEFDDGTKVQLDERTDSVQFDWGRGRNLTLRFDDAIFLASKGAFFDAIEALGALADIFTFSEFAVEEDFPRLYRVDLFRGSIEFTRPRLRNIRGGEFAEIRQGRPPKTGRISPRRERQVRARFAQWEFSRAPEKAQVTVPNVERRSLRDARRRLRDRGLRWQITGPTSGDVRVTRQRPAARTRVDEGTTIRLTTRTVEPEPVTVTVPNVVRLSLRDALRRLRARGLRWTINGPTGSGATVTGQSRRAGSQIARGATVRLTTRIFESQIIQ